MTLAHAFMVGQAWCKLVRGYGCLQLGNLASNVLLLVALLHASVGAMEHHDLGQEREQKQGHACHRNGVYRCQR